LQNRDASVDDFERFSLSYRDTLSGGHPKVGFNRLPESIRSRRQLRDVVACEAEDEPVWRRLHEARLRLSMPGKVALHSFS
jgi:hypothetical protein